MSVCFLARRHFFLSTILIVDQRWQTTISRGWKFKGDHPHVHNQTTCRRIVDLTPASAGARLPLWQLLFNVSSPLSNFMQEYLFYSCRSRIEVISRSILQGGVIWKWKLRYCLLIRSYLSNCCCMLAFLDLEGSRKRRSKKHVNWCLLLFHVLHVVLVFAFLPSSAYTCRKLLACAIWGAALHRGTQRQLIAWCKRVIKYKDVIIPSFKHLLQPSPFIPSSSATRSSFSPSLLH